jgi:lipopolysaccharide export system protein LptA
MKRSRAFAAACVLTLALAVPAAGQVSRGGGPIQIEAATVELIPNDRVAIFTGNVIVVQGQTQLRSATMRVQYREARGAAAQPQGAAVTGDIERMTADGEVFYATPEERARGDRAVFEAATDTITITGNVILTRGQDVVRGDTLTINATTRRSVIRSNQSSQRVRGVFFPAESPPAKQ